jgi:hypothetical protein
MKHLEALILISCLLFVLNANTTFPLQFQENKQVKTSLRVVESKSSTINTEKVDINEEHTSYININEKTFINLLNANFDNLSLIEGIWSNEKNTYKIGIQKTQEKGRYIAFILNSQEPTIKKGEIIAEFFDSEFGYIYSTEYYLEDKTKIVTKTYVDEYGMLLIFPKKQEKKNMIFFRDFPISEATEEKEKVSDLNQSLAKEGETVNNEYYVQVGTWRNFDYAEMVLLKIKKYYPQAYIAKQNVFKIIRIPGVLTEKQGAIMSKDIEKKFNLKPIIVLKKQ